MFISLHKYLISEVIFIFLDQIALVRSKCVPRRAVPTTCAPSTVESNVPVGIDANGKPPAVGVDGIPIGGFTMDAPVETKKKNRCCPYDFDSTRCITINNRLMCGYDKNFGEQKNDQDEVDSLTDKRCRYRAGRIECGYKESNSDGIRRPPAWDKTLVDPNADADDNTKVDNNYNTNVEQRGKLKYKNHKEGTDDSPDDYNVVDAAMLGNIRRNPNRDSEYVTEPVRMFTQCVEIKDRIVCSPVRY